MTSKKGNIYDFDHTIYKGDASLDFILYYISRHPRSWRFLPGQLFAALRYIFGNIGRKQFKEHAFIFLKDITEVDLVLETFWKRNEHKIAQWYRATYNPTDVIVSASPEFLLVPMVRRLGTKTLIATRMDSSTGHIDGENCRGDEKVKRLRAEGVRLSFHKAYSDSLSDAPLLELADHSCIVKGERIIPYHEYRESAGSRLKSLALIRFLFVGGVNALIGILLSYVFSLATGNPVASFVVGYALSLVISYFLNSVITFRNNRFSVRQFAGFVVAYLPNFGIQFICVVVFVGLLDVYPLIAYILAVAIAVPITFLLLSQKIFNKDGSV